MADHKEHEMKALKKGKHYYIARCVETVLFICVAHTSLFVCLFFVSMVYV